MRVELPRGQGRRHARRAAPRGRLLRRGAPSVTATLPARQFEAHFVACVRGFQSLISAAIVAGAVVKFDSRTGKHAAHERRGPAGKRLARGEPREARAFVVRGSARIKIRLLDGVAVRHTRLTG